MVIAEARRTYTYLSLFGYHVDAVIANRLLPDAITDPWFKRWRELHADHLDTIEASFAPLPVLRAELADDELVGLDKLRQFGALVYGDRDPAAALHVGEPLRVTKRGSNYHLTLQLPFAEHDDLDVGRKDDELLIRVGPYRRALLLPDSLRRRPITSAALKEGKLRVVFQGSTADKGDEPWPNKSSRTGRAKGSNTSKRPRRS
jgi:arsenite-transporting ATPase